MADDPDPEAQADLVVTAAEGTDREALAEALEEAGATVRAPLRFGALRVECAERTVAAVCALDGIAEIETDATREIAGGDAGEDV